MTLVIEPNGEGGEAHPMGPPRDDAHAPRERRGWREPLEPGLYKNHRVGCRSSTERQPGRRCGCPFLLTVPGDFPGSTRQVQHPGPVRAARAEKRRLQAAGYGARPATPEPEQIETVQEFFIRYLRLRERSLAPSTLYTIDETYRLRIGPAIGDLPLREVTRERVLEFVNGVAANATSTRTVEKTLAVLRAALSAAVEWGRLDANPAMGIKAARFRLAGDVHDGPRGERRVLSAAELRQLFAATTNPRIHTLLRTAAECGLRRGELIGLRWGDIDLDGRAIVVRRSVWQDRTRGGKRTEKPTKGRNARTIRITDTLTRALTDWYAQSVVADRADPRGYVWPGTTGGPMAADTPTQALERALTDAGLLDHAGKPLVSLHGLRHGAGSLLLSQGVPLIVVSRFLGHADVQITAGVYSHLVDADAQLAEAARRMQAALEAADAARPAGLDQLEIPEIAKDTGISR